MYAVGGEGILMTSSGKLSDIVSMTEANLQFLWRLALQYISRKQSENYNDFPIDAYSI